MTAATASPPEGTLQVTDEQLDRYFTENEDKLRQLFKDKLGPEGGDPEETVATKLDKKEQFVYDHFINNGWERPSEAFQYRNTDEREDNRMKLNELFDAIEPSDRTLVLPRVVTRIVKDAIEPAIVLTALYRTIRFSAGTSLEFPALGAIEAADMGPAQEYPEEQIEMAGTVVAMIGKSGVAIRITDEMIRWSQFDLMRMMIQAGGRAMIRLKEKKAALKIEENGQILFNNAGLFGIPDPGGVGAAARAAGTQFSTSGRDRVTAPNGSYTINDLFAQYADLVNKGFIPNGLIMNPVGWLIFAMSGELRAFGFANGGPLWMATQGAPGRAQQWETGGISAGTGKTTGDNPLLGTTFTAPFQFPAPFRIIVSPFINFDTISGINVTNIIMADLEEIGLIVIDEDLVTDEWDDPARDIRKMKFRERYGFAVLNEGQAISIAKDVVVTKSYDFEDRFVFDAATASLPAVPDSHPLAN